jgi:CDGSH-type Zn-finger protein/uncharacterized Fe-S cluster protein YjdI
MDEKTHTYRTKDIEVSYRVGRCIHAAECVRGLPAVFDPNRRPWIDPDNATADDVARVVSRCPTGALRFRRTDGGASETPGSNVVDVDRDGPLYVRGDVVLSDGADEVIVEDTRVALCRCGASKKKPFCDGSHSDAGFVHDGSLGEGGVKNMEVSGDERLRVRVSRGGPLLVRGDFVVRSADGSDERRGSVVAFCRCGHSGNKPFCDGTHRRVGISE